MLHERMQNQTMNGMPAKPDPEVEPKAKRRTFSEEYKRRILAEVDACTEPGDVGALLRREGLYSSHLTTWRRQRQNGGLVGLAPKKRGRKKDEQAVEITKLQCENKRLRKQLEQAELIIAAQKKLAQALEAHTDNSERS